MTRLTWDLFCNLIRCISRALQKLVKYFNGTAISTSFVLPSAGVLSVIIDLNLNDLKSVIVAFGTSLWYYHKFPDVFE